MVQEGHEEAGPPFSPPSAFGGQTTGKVWDLERY